MSNEFNFNIGEEAVKTIIELRDQEPGEKEYGLFLQIDGVHGNQFTYDLSFLDVEQSRSDDTRVDFGNLAVIIAAKDVDKFEENIISKSFFEKEKLIIISRSTDKIFKTVENLIKKNIDDVTILLKSNVLEKKSKLRNFFEKNKMTICIPFYEDSNQSLNLLAHNFLKGKKE